jgi:hypothetical protein
MVRPGSFASWCIAKSGARILPKFAKYEELERARRFSKLLNLREAKIRCHKSSQVKINFFAYRNESGTFLHAKS